MSIARSIFKTTKTNSVFINRTIGLKINNSRKIPLGNISKLFGKPLRAFATTLVGKPSKGTRLIAVPNGNNAKDWAIRSQAPTGDIKQQQLPAYGEGSETRW